jgi:hypothetical protein
LPTSDALNGTGIYAEKYPKTVSVDAGKLKDQVSAYGVSFQEWLAPKGWTGSGGEGVDGGVTVNLYPQSGVGPSITYREIPACQGCMTSAAAPYFSRAMEQHNKQTGNFWGNNDITVPEGLQVSQISPTLVTYTLPAWDGYVTKGVAFYGPDEQGDTYFESAEFTLSASQSDLVDFLSQYFIKSHKLK